jgi:hypothetical protein
VIGVYQGSENRRISQQGRTFEWEAPARQYQELAKLLEEHLPADLEETHRDDVNLLWPQT